MLLSQKYEKKKKKRKDRMKEIKKMMHDKVICLFFKINFFFHRFYNGYQSPLLFLFYYPSRTCLSLITILIP